MIRKLVGAAVALSMIATPALADGLIDNVNGITMDADGRVMATARSTCLIRPLSG